MCRETASELLVRSDLPTRRAPASRAFFFVRSGLRAVDLHSLLRLLEWGISGLYRKLAVFRGIQIGTGGLFLYT